MADYTVTPNRQAAWAELQKYNTGVAFRFNAGDFSYIPYSSSSGTSVSSAPSNKKETYEEWHARKLEESKNAKENERLKKAELYAKRNNSTVFEGLTKKDEENIKKYCADKLEIKDNLAFSLGAGLALGGVASNPRIAGHLQATWKSAFFKNSATNLVFDRHVRNSELWKKNPEIMQEAFSQLHKAEVRSRKSNSRGLFKRSLRTKEFNQMKELLKNAIDNGNGTIDDIAKATVQIREANNLYDGKLQQFGRWATNKFRKTPKQAPKIDIPNVTSDVVTKGAKQLKGTVGFKGALKSSVGGKMGVFFALTQLIPEYSKIKTAYAKGSNSGKKQLKQSVVKFIGNWGGYVLGEAVGKWGGAKLGAMIGSAICPGLGTAIGAIAGVVVGSIASHYCGKLAREMVGHDVVNDITVAQNINENKDEFIKSTIAQVEADKDLSDLPPEQRQAINKFYQLYGTTA